MDGFIISITIIIVKEKFMPDYNKYMMRHGEYWVQDIVEQIERVEGVRHQRIMTLEERWNALKDGGAFQPSLAA